MSPRYRLRLFVELSLGIICGSLALLTLIWRDWIEAIVRIDPDQHSGALEWGIVLGLATVTAVLALVARLEWRGAIERSQEEESSSP